MVLDYKDAVQCVYIKLKTQPEVFSEALSRSLQFPIYPFFNFCKLTEHAQLRVIIFICEGI